MNIEISREHTAKSSPLSLENSSQETLSQKLCSVNSQEQSSKGKSESHLSEHEAVENNLLLEMAGKYLLQEYRPSVMNIEISREHTEKSGPLSQRDSSQETLSQKLCSVESQQQISNTKSESHLSQHEVPENNPLLEMAGKYMLQEFRPSVMNIEISREHTAKSNS